ncbi:MAG: hypothetical protein J0M20_05490 [Burkholderiales bacterium]|nr:hypothetical protein [Burkholderiales bacterium]
MKKVLFGLSLLVSAAAASAYPVCVSFAPAGYCDAMQYDAKKSATWVSYDCAGSNGEQTKAKYKKKAATTECDGTKGCNPSATYGWDTLNWAFNPKGGTGTLTGMYQGSEYILQQDMPIEVIEGACVAQEGGRSTLAR